MEWPGGGRTDRHDGNSVEREGRGVKNKDRERDIIDGR